MSMTNTLVLAAASANEPGALPGAATAETQKTTAVVNVVGKGSTAGQTSVGELIEFQFTGLLVVFVVLGGLTLMCILMAKILQVIAPEAYYGKPKAGAATPPPAAPAPAAAVAQPAAAQSIHPGLRDEELIAILAVAASEAVGQAVSIVKFRHMGSMDWTWSVQGRVSLHTSHNPQGN